MENLSNQLKAIQLVESKTGEESFYVIGIRPHSVSFQGDANKSTLNKIERFAEKEMVYDEERKWFELTVHSKEHRTLLEFTLTL